MILRATVPFPSLSNRWPGPGVGCGGPGGRDLGTGGKSHGCSEGGWVWRSRGEKTGENPWFAAFKAVLRNKDGGNPMKSMGLTTRKCWEMLECNPPGSNPKCPRANMAQMYGLDHRPFFHGQATNDVGTNVWQDVRNIVDLGTIVDVTIICFFFDRYPTGNCIHYVHRYSRSNKHHRKWKEVLPRGKLDHRRSEINEISMRYQWDIKDYLTLRPAHNKPEKQIHTSPAHHIPVRVGSKVVLVTLPAFLVKLCSCKMFGWVGHGIETGLNRIAYSIQCYSRG